MFKNLVCPKMLQLNVVLATLLLSAVLIKGHPARPLLSQCAQAVANNNNVHLHCSLENGQFLDYNEIRAFTQGRSDKFNVSIDCAQGAVIHLPWPFSAMNVISLQVRGCETVGFISEMFDPYPLANELKHVSLIDIKHRITIKELYESFYMHDSVPVEYECGLRNVAVQVFRNIQYKFPPPSGTMEELIMLEELMSKNTMEKLLSHNSVCRFPYLQYLEESGHTSFSSVRFKLMEATSLYPELKYYVSRNNSLPTIPKEFTQLTVGFLPKLEVLDFSDNNIKELNFTFHTRAQQSSPLIVHLRNNKIQYVGAKLVDSLMKNKNVIMDIRDNPLVCTCDLYRYVEYLLTSTNNVSGMNDAYTTFTCLFDKDGIQELHSSTDTAFATKLCKTS